MYLMFLQTVPPLRNRDDFLAVVQSGQGQPPETWFGGAYFTADFTALGADELFLAALPDRVLHHRDLPDTIDIADIPDPSASSMEPVWLALEKKLAEWRDLRNQRHDALEEAVRLHEEVVAALTRLELPE